jgi:hypothetical protein
MLLSNNDKKKLIQLWTGWPVLKKIMDPDPLVLCPDFLYLIKKLKDSGQATRQGCKSGSALK